MISSSELKACSQYVGTHHPEPIHVGSLEILIVNVTINMLN